MEPTFEHRTIDGAAVAVVEYPDGTLFTVGDWQGPQPQTSEDVPDYTWYNVPADNPADTSRWYPAIMLLGWPRIL